MWPTRQVAVALGAALRTKEGQATEKRKSRAARAWGGVEILFSTASGPVPTKKIGHGHLVTQDWP